MKSRNSLNMLFSLSVLLFASPLSAAWYQVEVIVFDQLSPNFDGELWYENPGLPDRSNSIELIEELADDVVEEPGPNMTNQRSMDIIQSKAELIPYLQLPIDDLKLEGVQRVLKLSREYRPLMHVAWQQQGLSTNNARAVHIQKFEDPEELTVEEGLAHEPDDLDALIDNSNTEEDYYQVLELIFDGTVRLRSSKFLHVDVDIAYFSEYFVDKETMQDGNTSMFVQQADYVRLQESRKIRLNEIHYFDHPLFGVILRVSRLQLN